MDRRTRKRLILAGIALLVFIALIYGFWPEAMDVETAVVERGTLQVTVEEEGETQVAETYVISSPVAAYARRIELEPGDLVERGEPVVLLEPPRSTIMDPRSQAQAVARVASAEAAVQQARQNVEAAEATAEEAREERDRIEGLFEEGSATQQQRTRARTAAEQAEADLESARAAVEAAEAERTSARAAAQRNEGSGDLPVTDVLYAPVTGQVLAVHRESAGQVNPGEPILEIGNVNELEVHVDVLSRDAVRITPGTRVLVDQWGGEGVLEATVRRVEPRGFTEVSSLGVEEKRVTVVAGFASEAREWTGLGAEYRVLARIVVWEGDNVLVVPTAALFRTETGWAVYAVEGGEAKLRTVDVGWQTGLSAEIVSGLEEGDEVIVHPPNDLTDGARVQPRAD